MDEYKVCSRCGETKPISNFYRKHSICKVCFREYSKKYYEEHEEEIKAYKRKYYKEHPEQVAENRIKQKDKARPREQKKREQLFALYDEIKTPCAKCGENRLYIVEFHHIDPGEKEHTVSQMRNLKLVREEAKKCICLCANCHAEFHHFYGKHPENPIGSLEEYLGRRLIVTF